MIELKLDPKWKWAAMDTDRTWYMFMNKPEPLPTTGWRLEKITYFPLNPTPECSDWRDSLHEIVHQGGKVYLKKYVDIPADGEPVIVWNRSGERKRRYSKGVLRDEELVCYGDGSTKWSNDNGTCSWENWRRPTEEELND